MVKKLSSTKKHRAWTAEEIYEHDKDAGYVPTKAEVKAYDATMYAKPEKKKAFDRTLSLQKEPYERDLYYHANVAKAKLGKLSAKEQEKYIQDFEDVFDNKENLIMYVKTVFPKKYETGEIIEKIRLEKRGFKTKDDIDKFITDNNIVKKTPSLKNKIEKLIREITETPEQKPKIKTSNVSRIMNVIEDVINAHKQNPKLKTSNVSRAMNLLDDVINAPKHKVYKDDSESVEDIIKEVEKLSKKKPKDLKELVKADKVHLKYHPSEQDKKEAKIDKASLLLSPYKYMNMSVIDQLAHSMESPSYDNIVKNKINSYSYDIVNKFNKKYPDLMLRLFKTDKAVDKILLKKANNIEKKKVSEEKELARKKKYSEKAKEERKEKKNTKYKHFDDMTDVELKKFNQARNYYMRKSKESTILPKELNKSDPEGLNNICKELAEKGFDNMSEQLFMKIYEG